MSAGQITTALAFVVSGFVQLAIDNELTPIPDYGNQNSLMVINGYHQVQKNSEKNNIKLLQNVSQNQNSISFASNGSLNDNLII